MRAPRLHIKVDGVFRLLVAITIAAINSFIMLVLVADDVIIDEMRCDHLIRGVKKEVSVSSLSGCRITHVLASMISIL